MVAETLVAIAVAGALTGAGLNAARSWWQTEEAKWSWKKFIGGLVSGSISSLAVINFVALPEQASQGLIALFIGNALLGAGASTAFHQLHRDTTTVTNTTTVTT